MDNRFEMTIPVDQKMFNYMEAAVASPPPVSEGGWAFSAMLAEKTHGFLALSRVQEGLARGCATLDVFTWDVLLGEMSRLYVARPDDDLLIVAWRLRTAMREDARYVALHDRAAVYDRKMRKLARIRKRSERDRATLNEFARSQDPFRALS